MRIASPGWMFSSRSSYRTFPFPLSMKTSCSQSWLWSGVKPWGWIVKWRIRNVGAPSFSLMSHFILAPFEPSSLTGASSTWLKFTLCNWNHSSSTHQGDKEIDGKEVGYASKILVLGEITGIFRTRKLKKVGSKDHEP